MRLLWLSDSIDASSGFGTQSHLVLTGLRDRGWETASFAAVADESEEGDFTPEGIPERRIGPKHHADPKPLLEAVKHHKPDLVMALADLPMLPHLTAITDRPWGIWVPVDGRFGTDAWDPLIRGADPLVAMSAFGAGLLGERRGDTVPIVPHGIDTDHFAPLAPARRKTLRMSNGWADKFVVLCVAKNQKRKGFDRLIQGWASFARERPEAQLLLHTKGRRIEGWNLPAVCEQHGCADSVSIHQWTLGTGGLATLYGAADLFVLPTQGEGFGIPTIEAMACERVALVTDCTTTPEILGDAGDPIPAERVEVVGDARVERAMIDVDALVDRLAYWHADWKNGGEAAQATGERARARVLGNFTAEKVVDGWDALLRERLGSRARPGGAT